VHLIDDIYLIFSYLGRDPDLVDQVAYIVNGVVGSGIQFVYVEGSRTVERNTGLAFVARLYTVPGIETVDRLGQDAGTGGLANTPGTAK
jgi:hypothetical protein